MLLLAVMLLTTTRPNTVVSSNVTSLEPASTVAAPSSESRPFVRTLLATSRARTLSGSVTGPQMLCAPP